MRSVKSKRTTPERRLQAMLAGLGISGWRMNPEDIEGKPDFVFDDAKVAIFVDGCFWHKCPVCDRPMPVTNREYWEKKINRNVQRDKRRTFRLEETGWTVIRIWEHDLIKGEIQQLAGERISEAIGLEDK